MPQRVYWMQRVQKLLQMPSQVFFHAQVCWGRCFCQGVGSFSTSLAAKQWLMYAADSPGTTEGDLYYGCLTPLFDAILDGPLSMVDTDDQDLLCSNQFQAQYAVNQVKLYSTQHFMRIDSTGNFTNGQKLQIAIKKCKRHELEVKKKQISLMFQMNGCFTKLWKFCRFKELHEYLMSQAEGNILVKWQNTVRQRLQHLRQACQSAQMMPIYNYYSALVPQIKSIITYGIQEDISQSRAGPLRMVIQSLWPDDWNSVNNPVINKYIELLAQDAAMEEKTRRDRQKAKLAARFGKSRQVSAEEKLKQQKVSAHEGLMKMLDDQEVARRKVIIRRQERRLQVQAAKLEADPRYKATGDLEIKMDKRKQGQQQRRQKQRNAQKLNEARKHHLPLYMRKLERFVNRQVMQYQMRTTIYSVNRQDEELTQLRMEKSVHPFSYYQQLPTFNRSKAYYVPYYHFQEERRVITAYDQTREHVYNSYRVVDPEQGEIRYKVKVSEGPQIDISKAGLKGTKPLLAEDEEEEEN